MMNKIASRPSVAPTPPKKVAKLKRELAMVMKEWDFLREATILQSSSDHRWRNHLIWRAKNVPHRINRLNIDAATAQYHSQFHFVILSARGRRHHNFLT